MTSSLRQVAPATFIFATYHQRETAYRKICYDSTGARPHILGLRLLQFVFNWHPRVRIKAPPDTAEYGNEGCHPFTEINKCYCHCAFKTLLLTFKALQVQGPLYLTELLQCYELVLNLRSFDS